VSGCSADFIRTFQVGDRVIFERQPRLLRGALLAMTHDEGLSVREAVDHVTARF
jgi:hypothetical protein